MTESLVILDVQNIFYRAFWGTDMLVNSKGQPVNALHGFISMVNAIKETLKPTYMVMALESKNGSLRKNIYPQYKANRKEPPTELTSQLLLLPDLLNAMGYPCFSVDEYEADDVVGGLAVRAASNGMSVLIASTDKDFSQLVTDKIKLYDIGKNQVIGKVGVAQKYGIMPESFVDYLAIVGDSSDNYKGVDGVGPKGASKLLATFGSLENIYRNINLIKGATRMKLELHRQSAFLARDLARIKTEIPLNVEVPKSFQQIEDKERLIELLESLELKHHANSLKGKTIELGGLEIGVKGD